MEQKYEDMFTSQMKIIYHDFKKNLEQRAHNR